MNQIPAILLIISGCSFVLGFVIYRYDKKSSLHKWYVFFSLITGLWIFSNVLIGFLPTRFWINIVYSIGALVPVSAVMWVFYFCDKKPIKELKITLWLIAIFFAFLPHINDKLFLVNIRKIYFGGVESSFGVGFYFYIAYQLSVLSLIVYNLIVHYINAKEVKKIQTKFVLMGAFFWMTTVVVVSFILPMFGVDQFIPLDSPSTIIFLIFTAYAVTKHHLFGVKVIATELFTFAIWFLLFIKVFLSDGFQNLMINTMIFVFVVFFGILLIRSVIREVGQREMIEKLAKDIEKAYEAEKLAKEKIERAKAEDEALLSSIGEGVVAIDREGKITFINRAAEQMLFVDGKEAIGKPYRDILIMETEKGEAISKDQDPLGLAIASGKKIITAVAEGDNKIIYSYVRKDKTKFPVTITVAPVILNGKTIGAVDVFRDITVERQIDKSKTEFVSLASHQLRTPLTAIKWYSELILGGKVGKVPVKQKKYLEQVYQGNERMIKLINVMLNISRLEAGKIKINPVAVGVKELLENIIAEQQVDILKKKHKFTFECPDDLPKIAIDPDLIRMVFQNLLSNAIKYTPDNGKIDCVVIKKDNSILFKVQDNGIGIPEEQQKKIFGKLFRADNAFSHDPQGSGLGLYAAKMTVEHLGGKTWFESKPGKGTTFYVELPLGE